MTVVTAAVIVMKKNKLALGEIEDLAITIAIVGGVTTWLQQNFPPEDPDESIFKLLWLVVPSVFAAIFITRGKWWGKVGLQLRFVQAAPWYLLALVISPLLSGLLFLLAQAMGIVRLSPLSLASQWTMILPLIFVLLVKNIFEEFCFRGFFTSRFQDTHWSSLSAHLVTGGIWAMWHLPYWLVFLTPSKINELTGLSVMAFIGLGCAMLPLQAVFYGELRLRSGSLLPPYLMHVVANIVSFTLLENSFIHLDGPLAILVTPGTHGILYSLVLFALGVVMMRSREATVQGASATSAVNTKPKLHQAEAKAE